MAHMGCSCGNDMCNRDGHIVYDVFSRKDLTNYIQSKKKNNKFEDIYEDNPKFYEENTYFWLCDKCKKVHMWSYSPEYCYRTYELRKGIEEILVDDIKKLDEYYVININEYELVEETLIKDFIEKNPIKPYKYYITDDLVKIYIINTNSNKLERIYDLTYESFVEYNFELDSFDNLLIYTIDKKNKGYEYIVENGVGKKKISDDYPRKQVNFMAKVKSSNDESIGYVDSNLNLKNYKINIVDKFNKKEHSEKDNKKLKYIYVEYLDMYSDKLYSYKSDYDYKVGDIVIVPRGFNNEEVEAKIVNIVYYNESEILYPYNKLKEIIRYVEGNDYKKNDVKIPEKYRKLHKLSFENKKLLEEKKKCVCFFCCHRFNVSDISEWIKDQKELTAKCPSCGIDSVIPAEVDNIDITYKVIKEMKKCFFDQNNINK